MQTEVGFLSPSPFHQWVEETLISPDPEWLIPGFVPSQGVVIIAGRPKLSKKSWLMSLMMLSMGTGRRLGPFEPVSQTPVFVLSLEGTKKPVARRFKVMSQSYGFTTEDMVGSYIQQNGIFYLDEPRMVQALANFVLLNGIKCVALDTFARCFQGDENSSKDVGKAMRGVEKIREAGAAVILIHHCVKCKTGHRGNYPDPDSGLRGSSALAGAYDNIINIQDLVIGRTSEMWAIVGGKYMEFVAYRQEWDIRDDANRVLEYAQLKTFDGPQDLPLIDCSKA